MGRSFMGMLGGGDGNWPPDGGSREPIPGWGPIEVPDDLSALAEESARVRAELRTEARRRRRHRMLRRLRLAPTTGRSTIRLPLLLLSLTVAAALTALFAVGHPGQRTASDPAAAGPSVAAPRSRTLPALDLLDGSGRAVSVRGLLPAVILLTEGCACDALISATAGSTPPGVAVLVVARSVPAPPSRVSSPNRVRRLADPASELRSLLGLPAAGPTAGALVVTADADIALAAPTVTTADALGPALERLR
jgi:hypothetical protein